MGNLINLIGKKFARLEVLERSENKGENVCRKCKCDCGNILNVYSNSLRFGNTKSCGCLNHEPRCVTHGKTRTRIYGIRNAMRSRCRRENNNAYKNYGGRGIKCEWNSFEEFYKDMGPTYKDLLEIDRINNDGNYCKENCKWSTHKEQQNNRNDNVVHSVFGTKGTISQICDIYGVDYRFVRGRLERGRPLSIAMMFKKVL